jgi:two-component system OmpR family sensor kinase
MTAGITATVNADPYAASRPPPSSWRQRWRDRHRLPLRVTLVAAMLALVTMALLVIAVAGSTLLDRYLLTRVDSQLRTSATSFIRSNGQIPDSGSGRFGVYPGGGYYLAVSDVQGASQGSLLMPRTSSTPRVGLVNAAVATSHGGDAFTVASTSGSRKWRVLILQTADGSQNVTVALGLDDVNSTVNRLIVIDTVVSLIVLALLAGLGYVVVRGSLRRLVEVERTAEAIAAGDLSRRVAVADDHTEVGRLGTSLNTMLGQIEGAFRAQERSEQNARISEERMRRFVADAGHELRTPLTSVRGFAELYRLGAVTDEADLSRVMKRIEDEASRMGLLVEDLLLLARLDQQRPLEQKPVELLAIATDTVTDMHALHPERPVRLLTDPVGDPPVVIGDEGRLRQVLGNLLGNAITHTPAQTPVRVRIAAEGPFAVMEISDDGPGMRPEDTARVFERFFRADPSRVRSSGGSGLGLSIVAALVAAHGGTVDVRSALGVGTTFTVRIPLAGAQRPTAPPMPVGSHPGPPLN